ncbi:MAG: histidine kinase [Saprospiraceae bacterium]|nr:histidine kinase [Saprospiraceae bacterium]
MISVVYCNIGMVLAQPFPNLFFRTINEKNGLSSNDVRDIKEDKDGFIWIGTANGLNRYDGEKFTIFNQGDKRIRVFDNSVIKLHIDDQQNICINHFDGVSLTNIKNKSLGFTLGEMSDVRMTWKNGSIICSDKDGVFEIDRNGKKVLKKSVTTIKHNIPRYGNIFFHRDQIFTFYGSSVYQLDTSYNIIKEYLIKSGPTFTSVLNLYFDGNLCYINTWGNKIFILDLTSGSISTLDVLNSEEDIFISFKTIPWHFQDKDYLVIAAREKFILYDLKTKKGFQTIINGTIVNAFVDSKNNLWLCNEGEGIHIVSSLQECFEVTTITNNNERPWESYNYNLEKIDDFYWLSTRYHQGFFQLDKNKNIIRHYGKSLPKKQNIDKLLTYNQDGYDFLKYNHKIYVTSDFGFFEIDPIKQTETFVQLDDTDIKLRNIIPKKDGIWFVRSFHKGIYLYDSSKRKFIKLYKIVDQNGMTLQLNHLYEDSYKNLYVSTMSGLFQYNAQKDSFLLMKNTTMEKSIVSQVAEDKNRQLWIATYKGVYLFDSLRKEIKAVAPIHKVIKRSHNIKIDADNNVWFTTEEGIHYYHQTKKTVKSIHNRLELFNTTNFTLLGDFDDKFYVGADNHILKIDLSKFENYQVKTKLYVTSFLANNKEILQDPSSQKYILSPDEKNLRISFSAPSFDATGSITYMFKYKDSSEPWQTLNEGELYLPNLNYGQYHLEIIGKNEITNEFTNPRDILFEIKPPWYLTLWFKALLALLGALILFILYKYRIRQINAKLKIEKQYHEMITGLEMQNLRSQMNPHFIFNSLNSINRYVVENNTKLASDYISKFARLLRLILENSKHEFITLGEELEALKLYLHMEKVRFENEFDYEINIGKNTDIDNIMMPPLILQPFVENAIWHGLRNNEKGGVVTISIQKFEHTLVFNIEDDGVGRQKARDLKSKSGSINKSYGIDITLQRLKHLHKENDIVIHDLFDEDGKACGTKVTITMKTID